MSRNGNEKESFLSRVVKPVMEHWPTFAGATVFYLVFVNLMAGDSALGYIVAAGGGILGHQLEDK